MGPGKAEVGLRDQCIADRGWRRSDLWENLRSGTDPLGWRVTPESHITPGGHVQDKLGVVVVKQLFMS